MILIKTMKDMKIPNLIESREKGMHTLDRRIEFDLYNELSFTYSKWKITENRASAHFGK